MYAPTTHHNGQMSWKKSTRRRLAALLLLALLALAVLWLALPAAAGVTAAGDTIVYVDKDAAGAGTGGSWADAYTTLQAALDAANANGGTVYEIWVAEGVYYPDEGGSHTPDSRLESFRLSYDNVRLYGGFAGNETERAQRDWLAHPTVLSGDIDQNDLNSDGNGIAESWTDLVGANAYHVVYLDGETNQPISRATVLDGLIITAGDAGGDWPHYIGGGLYCAGKNSGHACSPALAALIFSGNRAEFNFYGEYFGSGAGMYNAGWANGVSSPMLTNVAFRGNFAFSNGGGMTNSGQGGVSSPVLTNVTFSGNAAGKGGAMLNQGWTDHLVDGSYRVGVSVPVLTNVTFEGNFATDGGAIYNWPNHNDAISSPQMTNVTFSGNSASELGGAIYNDSDGWGASYPLLENSILWGNTASDGSQVHNQYGRTSIVVTATIMQGGCPDGGRCTNVIDADPLLGELGSDGGRGQVLPLLPGSAAIDAAISNCPPTDQRGIARGTPCDLGAYESRGFVLSLVGGGNQTAPANTVFPLPLSVAVSEVGGGALPGAVITFTAPANGASLAPAVAAAAADLAGVAALTATANALEGSYSVQAAAPGTTSTVPFSLTNTCGDAIVVASNGASGPSSLRQALVDICDGGVITLQPGLGTIAVNEVDNWWYGPNAFPPINRAITIEGNGATIQNTSSTRLRFFYVGADPSSARTPSYHSPGAGRLELRHLTLTGGLAVGGASKYGGGGAGMGGAIFSQGVLTLTGVTLHGNSARGGQAKEGDRYGGGGMGEDVVEDRGGGFGGPISPGGSGGGGMDRVDGGSGGGGGFGLTDAGGWGWNGYGGGGGGTRDGMGGRGGNNGNGGGGSGRGSGGGAGSYGSGDGGGAFGEGGYSRGASYNGGGGVGGGGAGGYVGAGGGFGGGGGAGNATYSLGGDGGFGGGSGLGGGDQGYGGGDSYATVIEDTHGGGGGGGLGGAVFNHGGLLAVINSTLYANTAQGGDAIAQGGAGIGGAVFNLNGSVAILNSTLVSNTVIAGKGNWLDGWSEGGALYNLRYTLDGGIPDALITISNSILTGNSSDDLANHRPDNVADASGGGGNTGGASVTFAGPNFLKSRSNTGGSFVDTVAPTLGADPLFGARGDYGGGASLFPLLPNSPAIDAGSNCPPADQRGLPRSTPCDLGAFESQGFALVGSGSGQRTKIHFSFTQPLSLTLSSANGEPIDGGQVVFTAPGSGPGITPGGTTTLTISGGGVSLAVRANGTVGSYEVTAGVRGGISSPVRYSLSNTPTLTGELPGRLYLPAITR